MVLDIRSMRESELILPFAVFNRIEFSPLYISDFDALDRLDRPTMCTPDPVSTMN
jgi:hypothetical protein